MATAIRAITEETAKVKTLVDEVNLGSQEQSRGIEQIGKAITQMEQVTQKTAANAEESAAAAEELNAQSETMKDIVERLTAMVRRRGIQRPCPSNSAPGKCGQRESAAPGERIRLRPHGSAQGRVAPAEIRWNTERRRLPPTARARTPSLWKSSSRSFDVGGRHPSGLERPARMPRCLARPRTPVATRPD